MEAYESLICVRFVVEKGVLRVCREMLKVSFIMCVCFCFFGCSMIQCVVFSMQLYARLVAAVDSENFLGRIKALQQASADGTCNQFPFKVATGLSD